jgi:hypothetical protein
VHASNLHMQSLWIPHCIGRQYRQEGPTFCDTALNCSHQVLSQVVGPHCKLLREIWEVVGPQGGVISSGKKVEFLGAREFIT